MISFNSTIFKHIEAYISISSLLPSISNSKCLAVFDWEYPQNWCIHHFQLRQDQYNLLHHLLQPSVLYELSQARFPCHRATDWNLWIRRNEPHRPGSLRPLRGEDAFEETWGHGAFGRFSFETNLGGEADFVDSFLLRYIVALWVRSWAYCDYCSNKNGSNPITR